MQNWDQLRILLAVSRAGSVSGGARALGVDKATVSRHLSALEESLGTRVLRKKPGAGLAATEAGQSLLAVAMRAEQTLDDVVRAARVDREAPQGIVRVTTTDVLAVHFVAPLLPRLREALPLITLEMVVTPQVLDLSRDAEMALRLSRPTRADELVRRAGSIETAIVCSPEYLRGRDPAEVPRPLEAIALGEHFFQHGENAWMQGVDELRITLRTTSLGVAMAAALGGLGATLAPRRVAEAAGLVVLTAFKPVPRPVWLVTHPDFARSARVRAVSDFFVEALSD
ncbi:MAG: LysR family transcriptional regulator [Myxococcales bacterium]|nr:LysR family transcriptional regulator [Myxococcales bacterium]